MAAVNDSTLSEQLRAVTGFTADIISDSDLVTIINTCLDEWCHYRPGLSLTAAASAITTVQDQPNYALPADALWIVEVGWNPGVSDDDYDATLDTFYSEFALETFDPLHPSELFIINQRFNTYRRFFEGKWKVLNGEIWLIPPPIVSGDKVAVYYAEAKTLEDLDTIKDQVFFRLCKGALKERRAMELIPGGGWRAGSYQVSAAVGEQMLREAHKELAWARSIASNGYTAMKTGPGMVVREP